MAMGIARSARTLGFACLLLALAEPVLAECTDVPAPGVYWRRCLQDGQDLRDVDLTGATLRDASFKRSDLTGATLIDADARRAKFISTNLHEVQFDNANLVQADFTNANLTGASLKNADLTWARLFRANLSGADLTGARLDETDLLKAEFSGATWVDGTTICAEGSLGQCNPERAQHKMSEIEASG
jgi:uncharacterized protein YjbI with pentapeptide repeats